jgi:hypothetical protein
MKYDAFCSVSTVNSKRHAEIIIGDYLRVATENWPKFLCELADSK